MIKWSVFEREYDILSDNKKCYDVVISMCIMRMGVL